MAKPTSYDAILETLVSVAMLAEIECLAELSADIRGLVQKHASLRNSKKRIGAPQLESGMKVRYLGLEDVTVVNLHPSGRVTIKIAGQSKLRVVDAWSLSPLGS